MRTLTFVLAGIGFIAFSKTARADIKIYPGANCHAVTNGGNNNPFATTGTGRLVNTTGNAANAICPLVRDDARTTSGPDDSWVSNQAVVSNQSAGTLGCTAFSANPQGSNFFMSTAATSVPGTVTLTFAPVTRFANGSYFLVCNVPGTNSTGMRSGVYSYRINEDFTDEP